MIKSIFVYLSNLKDKGYEPESVSGKILPSDNFQG